MPVKEPGYFSRDLRPVPCDSLEKYLTLFAGAEAMGRLVGEASPKYLYSSTGLREIREINPDAKLIFIIRSPVQLVQSMHGQLLREGLEDVDDFESAWRLNTIRRQGERVPRRCKWPQLLDYERWGALGTRLMDVFEVFPRKNVLVLSTETLKVDPAQGYSRVLAFLGLEHDGRTEFKRENVYRALRFPRAYRAVVELKRAVGPALDVVTRMRGGQGLGLLRLVSRMTTSDQVEKPVLGAEFQRELADYFSHEVEMMEVALGKYLPEVRRNL